MNFDAQVYQHMPCHIVLNFYIFDPHNISELHSHGRLTPIPHDIILLHDLSTRSGNTFLWSLFAYFSWHFVFISSWSLLDTELILSLHKLNINPKLIKSHVILVHMWWNDIWSRFFIDKLYVIVCSILLLKFNDCTE